MWRVLADSDPSNLRRVVELEGALEADVPGNKSATARATDKHVARVGNAAHGANVTCWWVDDSRSHEAVAFKEADLAVGVAGSNATRREGHGGDINRCRGVLEARESGLKLHPSPPLLPPIGDDPLHKVSPGRLALQAIVGEAVSEGIRVPNAIGGGQLVPRTADTRTAAEGLEVEVSEHKLGNLQR